MVVGESLPGNRGSQTVSRNPLTSDPSPTMIREVRTTQNMDDDVLQTPKERAGSCGLTTGRVISDLARDCA